MKIIKISAHLIPIEDDFLIIEATDFLSSNEYIDRLTQLGWIYSTNSQAHAKILAPKNPKTGSAGLSSTTGQEAMVVFSTNRANWKKNWGKQVQDLRKISRGLDFVWESPFVIPKGFNPYTLQIEEVQQSSVRNVTFRELSGLNVSLFEILDNNQWKGIGDISYSPSQIMFSDESIKEFRYDDQVVIRPKGEIS